MLDSTMVPDLEKANYVGNKRRLAKYIVDRFPEGAESVFDPMCGCSAVLIEAARRGMRVKANDLSLVPYWYSKGVFEGGALSDGDLEALLGTAPKAGWLTDEWEGIYPRPREVRRYLDGLALAVREMKGAKGWAAKAAVSTLLQRLYAESGSGYSTRRHESLPAVRRQLEGAVREVNARIAEAGGRGEVGNEDARKAAFPKADVVYFDPPYFKRDKGALKYFQAYRVMNSVLKQDDWKAEDLDPDELPGLLERLCESARHVLVSTSSNEVVPYARELARHKAAVRKLSVSYEQPSGFGGRDARQRQHLYVAKAPAPGQDPGKGAAA